MQAIKNGDFDGVKKRFSEQKRSCSEIINKMVHERSEFFGVYRYCLRSIHYAAYYGNIDILEYFLQNGAGVSLN